MQVAVELQNISKIYRKGSENIQVLHGLSLKIPTGEFIALMGPSGSGKTTLLNLIAGLDRATQGEVHVGGQRIDTLSARALAHWRSRNIGFVFQFHNLLPVMSAAQNVELPLLLTDFSSSERKRRVAAALEIVGLADRAHHKPSELSGGQQQRVSIARAIVTDPTILVCDEPTGDLDRDAADRILTLLELLNAKHGKTIVMVTHDPLAARRATRQITMDKGRLADVLREVA